MSGKRAARACKICHERKVRCDVAVRGTPCSNCARNSASCLVEQAHTARPKRQRGQDAVPASSVHTFNLGASTTGAATTSQSSNAYTIPFEHAPPSDKPYDATPAQSLDPDGNPTVVLSTDTLDLPVYVARLPRNLDADVFGLLQRRKAFTLPSQPIVNELLRVFICYVYPLLPLMDLDRFVGAVQGTNEDTISIVLLQAVMFTAVTFADLTLLQREGFRGHAEARKVYFDRVKLLYEMDVESDPTTLLQVLLLMTYWYDSQNDLKGRFYWLRIAFSLATDLGLDRPRHLSAQSNERRLARKLWYCCIMRDKILSLTERRQGAHSGDRNNPRQLLTDDLDDLVFSQAFNDPSIAGLQAGDAVSIGRLCAQKVRLCLIIERVLDSQYELSGLRRIGSHDTFMVLIPKSRGSSSEVSARDRELREWHSASSCLREAALGEDHRRNGRILGIHSATLELLYLTALCAVHRPMLLHDQAADSADGAMQAFSRRTLRSAAQRISEIGRHLQEGQLVQFLPPLAVGACIAASIQHLKDALSPHVELRATGRLYLDQTMQAFGALRQKYKSADCTFAFIERVKLGKLPYGSFEWEDRADHDTGDPENTNVSLDTGPRANGNWQAGMAGYSPSVAVTAMEGPGSQRDTRFGLVNTAQSMFGVEELPTTPDTRLSNVNLEAFSEVLLTAPFDANNIDWTSLDWSPMNP